MKHHFLTDEQLKKYDDNIDNDKNIPDLVKNDPTIREVCRSGLWLVEQLRQLKCPDEYVVRIQYTAGAGSFGREPWEVHMSYLQAYKDNDLEFELDLENLN